MYFSKVKENPKEEYISKNTRSKELQIKNNIEEILIGAPVFNLMELAFASSGSKKTEEKMEIIQETPIYSTIRLSDTDNIIHYFNGAVKRKNETEGIGLDEKVRKGKKPAMIHSIERINTPVSHYISNKETW
jgi:hypothetical protein